MVGLLVVVEHLREQLPDPRNRRCDEGEQGDGEEGREQCEADGEE